MTSVHLSPFQAGLPTKAECGLQQWHLCVVDISNYSISIGQCGTCRLLSSACRTIWVILGYLPQVTGILIKKSIILNSKLIKPHIIQAKNHNWKCYFPKSPYVRRLVWRSVYHNFLPCSYCKFRLQTFLDPWLLYTIQRHLGKLTCSYAACDEAPLEQLEIQRSDK